MPKKIVSLENNLTYHVYNRGVDKRVTFLDDNDYLRFYSSLQYFNSVIPATSLFEQARKNLKIPVSDLLVKVHAYCLLPNHYHLILTQISDNGISEFMKRLGGGYTSFFNGKYERTGALFQGTFKRALVDSNEKLLYLSAYVNYNYLIHNLKQKNKIFVSSSDIYSGNKPNKFIYPEIILKQFNSHKKYAQRAMELAMHIREQRQNEKRMSGEELFIE